MYLHLHDTRIIYDIFTVRASMPATYHQQTPPPMNAKSTPTTHRTLDLDSSHAYNRFVFE